MDEKDLETNLIERFVSEYEKRTWVATYERMQRDGAFTDDAIKAADFAVLEYRKRA